MISKGYDYWALGHVHRREEVRTGEPWVVFPGNLQGRHVHEQGEKGCTLVRVEEDGSATVEAIQLDVVRWKSLEIPWKTDDQDDLIERVGHRIEGEISHLSDQLLALRLIFTGSDLSLLDHHVRSSQLLQQLRAVAADRGGGQVWLKDLRFVSSDSEKDASLVSRKKKTDLDLLQALIQYSPEESEKVELLGIIEELAKKLPIEAFSDEEFQRKIDPERFDEFLDNTRRWLLSRFLVTDNER